MKNAEDAIVNAGRILESDPPQRLLIAWRNEARPELKAEGDSRCAYQIDADGDMCRLTIVHEIALTNSKLIELTATSWPKVVSSLKSLLETGAPLPRPADVPAQANA